MLKPKDRFQNKWKVVEPRGAGGQGRVYLVENLEETLELDTIANISEILWSARSVTASTDQYNDLGRKLRDAILATVEGSRKTKYALKVLHSPEAAKNPNNSQERMRREIEAMGRCDDRRIVKIVQAYPDDFAFVMDFIPYTLSDSLIRADYIGKPLVALKAFYGLVQAVQHVHKQGIVHRDIHPGNIFRQKPLDPDGPLILGDFGISYLLDRDETRPSGTVENVGTWQFMPMWAQRRRIEVPFSFDVDSLGRVLWWMISGDEPLQFDYIDDPMRSDQNLEIKFHNVPGIEQINPILHACIFEHKDHAKTDTNELLSLVSKAIQACEAGGSMIPGNRICRACANGTYKDIVNRDRDLALPFFDANTNHTFRILECDMCGHLQIFHFDNDTGTRPEWHLFDKERSNLRLKKGGPGPIGL